ncbi:MAG: hypothetical protein M1816_006956 [Peltula sp. TS41687]|nr:MAG: hypothetical protein M1816_006956 [Peltula sp. TS41687]
MKSANVSQSVLSLAGQRQGPPDEANNDPGLAQTRSASELEKGEESGALSQRLAEMTEEALDNAGPRAGKLLEESGFSEELKKKLQERLEASSFKAEQTTAFAQAMMPTGVGKGSRDIAAAQAWTGTEEQQDAVLRMLTDAHKPLRGGRPKSPSPMGPPNVDLQRRAPQRTSGERLANARDRSSIYSLAKDPNMSQQEKEQMRKELKERFSPGARPMPTSLHGLASLANERIDDAIARGLFKNLPRGKVIERDYNASSPFLDTTEYFMNKIIQKQEIVPPWIEKQQELSKAVGAFRNRLRSDWRRHAARTIASKGGSLDDQIRKAEGYAAAEKGVAPTASKKQSVDTVTQGLASPNGVVDTGTDSSSASAAPTSSNPPEPASSFPFRDPTWESAERPYQALSITNLNNLTRSYNLMAPDLAKKPYFSLNRELQSCYADVAPQLPDEIRERARAPVVRVEKVGHRPGGIFERFGGDTAKVHDSKKPNYGFKEFWRDLWGGEKVRT